MTERELFLKHMRSIGSANFMFELDEDGNFDDMSMAYAWSAWQASVNRQGYKLVPVDVLERCIYHIGIASCHPANSLHDDQQMESDIDALEKSIIGAVGN